jgi:hypothetical protein
MSNNTGGPAFPTGYDKEKGITMRDYFAAKAMQSIISSKTWTGDIDDTVEDAYKFADAMLKARN